MQPCVCVCDCDKQWYHIPNTSSLGARQRSPSPQGDLFSTEGYEPLTSANKKKVSTTYTMTRHLSNSICRIPFLFFTAPKSGIYLQFLFLFFRVFVQLVWRVCLVCLFEQTFCFEYQPKILVSKGTFYLTRQKILLLNRVRYILITKNDYQRTNGDKNTFFCAQCVWGHFDGVPRNAWYGSLALCTMYIIYHCISHTFSTAKFNQ